MILCCLIPMLGLGLAWLFGVPLGTLGTFALLLLCPLGHIILMRGMGHKSHRSETDDNLMVSREQGKQLRTKKFEIGEIE